MPTKRINVSPACFERILNDLSEVPDYSAIVTVVDKDQRLVEVNVNEGQDICEGEGSILMVCQGVHATIAPGAEQQ